MYAKLFRNMITNGKSQTLLSDFFFFGERAAVHRLPKSSTSQYQRFEHKGMEFTNKGWKDFKRKKIPQSSEKQRRARLNFSRKYSKLTAEDWENFLFTDECRKYLVRYPNPENHIV